ncbi:hypothetical protein Tco_1245485 [Tanacetum coccineum]
MNLWSVGLTRGGGVKVEGRAAALRSVDRQLAKGNFKLAVKHLRLCQPPLRGFSAAKQSSVTSEDNDLYLEGDIVDPKQVMEHEAGHFLVGYLLGVLPKQYKFSSIEDVKQDEVIDASVKFVGFEFLAELEDVVLSEKHLHEVKPSSRLLCKFACVIVGGLVAEHLVFGYSKGHHADVEKLDAVLKWLQFTEDEAHTMMRWAVLNTLLILRRHGEARAALVEAMAQGRSIGNCIDMIETNLNHLDI